MWISQILFIWYLFWIASRRVPLTPPASWHHIILVFIPVSGYYIINKVFNYYNTESTNDIIIHVIITLMNNVKIFYYYNTDDFTKY